MLQGTEILTTAQMRGTESAAMASGQVTGLELMERAGAAVAGHIRLRWPKAGRATVLCGPGNNGGDGYVIARYLARAGWDLRVLGLDNTPGPDAAEMRRRWSAMGPILPLTEGELRREDADVYVDAIFGTGLTRAAEGEIAEILLHMGGSGGDWGYYRSRIVAVDCPSGLCLDSGVFLGRGRAPGDHDLCARLTVAFDSPKPGHLLARGPEVCGELVIADIGLEPWRSTDGRGALRFPKVTAEWPRFVISDRRRFALTDARRAAWLTKRDAPGHKFTHGHALIVAGGGGQGGAARLAARAALRIGAGLVTIAPPRSALIGHSGPPDALMRRGVDDAAVLTDLLTDNRISAIAIGPGCGVDRAAALLPAVLASKRSCVLDADALTAWAQNPQPLHRDCVLTPHLGEFARLFPDLAERLSGPPVPKPMAYNADPSQWAARLAQAQQYRAAIEAETGPAYSKLDAGLDAAARCGATILLKGPDTVIAAPNGRAVIHSAFDIPWLATAGAGDVLAGIIAGLLARGLDPLSAAATGALIHAQAARRHGPGLIADDLPEQIPGVFRDMG
ncbi:MAG: NAD(P)H-hydrate epimerase [Paracoccus sp. (in: a-proteobacteria)]|uniref:NAD(P)H-hydrate epimerase n=1 Tax=Paracoccus sp. TaxID=267 RepID=UPI0026DEB678|nr:NAD(P)H-hydrate epimerase [Paracoccus sp. (in: a-proteobacteria)]MDO5632928.1 NAD(P)H-hydrate epimerase [Paracoccus sp. (in: a-proteobacteria)]